MLTGYVYSQPFAYGMSVLTVLHGRVNAHFRRDVAVTVTEPVVTTGHEVTMLSAVLLHTTPGTSGHKPSGYEVRKVCVGAQ